VTTTLNSVMQLKSRQVLKLLKTGTKLIIFIIVDDHLKYPAPYFSFLFARIRMLDISVLNVLMNTFICQRGRIIK
jgi:hypothetical protein